MTRYKMVGNERIECTAEEVAELNALKTSWDNAAPARALAELRYKRDNLLRETDYLALSDVVMSEDMTTYRQALRNITNELTTVEQIEAVVFPTKPV